MHRHGEAYSRGTYPPNRAGNRCRTDSKVVENFSSPKTCSMRRQRVSSGGTAAKGMAGTRSCGRAKLARFPGKESRGHRPECAYSPGFERHKPARASSYVIVQTECRKLKAARALNSIQDRSENRNSSAGTTHNSTRPHPARASHAWRWRGAWLDHEQEVTQNQ